MLHTADLDHYNILGDHMLSKRYSYDTEEEQTLDRFLNATIGDSLDPNRDGAMSVWASVVPTAPVYGGHWH